MSPSDSAGHFIAGEWTRGHGTPFSTFNPATGECLWSGETAAAVETDAALLHAREALASWSRLSVDARAHILTRFAEAIEERRHALARTIALETGKPLWEALTEVSSVSGKIALSLKARLERTADKSPAKDAHLRFKPHGVALVIGAFNFPAHLANGHIVPALLAGNTVIYKPSELAPLTSLIILECWQEAGLPRGVLQCLQGDATTARRLLDGDINAVYFTGSYRTGLAIHRHMAERPEVIVALEMGGNNPLVIDEVENIDAALYATLLSTLLTAGQRCTCARRLLLPDSAFGDTFLTRLIRAFEAVRIGPFTDTPEPFMGPVISAPAARLHLEAQQALEALGGRALLRMQALREHTGFLSPGLMDMTGVSTDPDEEIFGPFAKVYRWHSLDEAIALSNHTRYGLASGIFTDDASRYQRYFDEVRAGLINWNRPTTGASGSLPFGGVGRSGNHRPSGWFAADYCASPVASLEETTLTLPETLLPGIREIHHA